MKRRRAGWSTPLKMLASVLATLVLLEFALAVALSLRDRRFFYTRPVPQATPEEQDRREILKARLHPYYGFAFLPGLTVRDIFPSRRIARSFSGDVEPPWIDTPVNAFGFLSPHSYPVPRTSANELLVAITGGSVAQWFSLQGTEQLAQTLRQHEPFSGRDVVIVNLASGGYKQPQQLLVLTHLLSLGQEFDILINLDGFNEAALSRLNREQGIDAAMPSSAHLKPLASLGSVATRTDLMARIASLTARRRELAAVKRSVQRSRSAIRVAIAKVRQRHLAAMVGDLTEQLGDEGTATDSILMLQPAAGDAEEFDYEQVAALWLESSRLMDVIATDRGISYFHFLQPNQYFSNRVWDAQEQLVALNERSRYREGVVQGYPLLLAALDRLAAQGTRAFSAVALFDDVDGPVYSDNCCHYNQRGNEILARFVAEKIVSNSDAAR